MNFNNFSIRTKLILLLSLSAMTALTIAMLSFSYSILISHKEDSLKSLTQLAKISSQNITASLIFDDQLSAENILKPFSINENIQMALVYDVKHKLFASYVSQNSIDADLQVYVPVDNTKELKSYFDWNEFWVCVPIVLDKEILGHLKIVSDTKQLKSKVLEQLIMLTIIGTLTLLFIVLLAFRLHKIFTKPIFKLLKIMENVAKNNQYDVEVSAAYNDEFKHLYNGFENMLHKIDTQNKKIDAIHQHTRDSINYSAGIQTALLPKKEDIDKFFNASFTLWQPKDTVGGDIYLFQTLRHEDEALLMVIDCTGHGVPGAFVTMIVKAIEKEIVAKLIKSDFEISPSLIMAYFNKHMKKLLRQDADETSSNTGFDGGIVYINKREKILKFSGSQTPLFVVQNDKLTIIKGDKQSVGYRKSDLAYRYKEYIVNLDEPTYIYVTTDGYLDQTGGEKGFLFGKKRFGKLVLDAYTIPFNKQRKLFVDTFNRYKLNQETKDDTTLVGFHLNLGETHDSK